MNGREFAEVIRHEIIWTVGSLKESKEGVKELLLRRLEILILVESTHNESILADIINETNKVLKM